ncbi:hypothetical protein PR048_032435 [Dryococelus australis]|uniref:Uncharacterized protein n=1 Tax=Dryococelus australis TaxID=614101 RepID=A0ABQ9G516_9NEOP|nr:hypothetical protein PR048_032435 [Dryococelus australis]
MYERRMNKVMRPMAMLMLHKAEKYKTDIQVELTQCFQKFSFYRALDEVPLACKQLLRNSEQIPHEFLYNLEYDICTLIGTLPNQGAAVVERLDCSRPTKANQVQYPRPVRKRESCPTMPLVGGFSRGSPVSRALAFRSRYIILSFHPHRLSIPRQQTFTRQPRQVRSELLISTTAGTPIILISVFPSTTSLVANMMDMLAVLHNVRYWLVISHRTLTLPAFQAPPPEERSTPHNFRAGSLPESRKWESCRAMLLVGGVFLRGIARFPVLPFRRCSILASFHPRRFPRPRCREPPKSLNSTQLLKPNL